MPSLNRVTLIGHLGRDVEVKETKGGEVANATVATEMRWQDKSSGEWKGKTEWHRIVAWRREAARLGQCLKGDLVLVEGRLETRKWKGQDGQDRYATEVIAETVMRLKWADEYAPRSTPPADRQQEDSFDDMDDLPFS